jgi:signal transduction histidine kinase
MKPYRDNSPSEQGSGIGLSIVREIINNHDGKISVTSKEGEGTKFYIYLKIKP